MDLTAGTRPPISRDCHKVFTKQMPVSLHFGGLPFVKNIPLEQKQQGDIMAFVVSIKEDVFCHGQCIQKFTGTTLPWVTT